MERRENRQSGFNPGGRANISRSTGWLVLAALDFLALAGVVGGDAEDGPRTARDERVFLFPFQEIRKVGRKQPVVALGLRPVVFHTPLPLGRPYQAVLCRLLLVCVCG